MRNRPARWARGRRWPGGACAAALAGLLSASVAQAETAFDAPSPPAEAVWAPEGGAWPAADGVVSASGLAPMGPRTAAVRIVLAPGWKTYWRLAGAAGYPPRLDWSGSENLAQAVVRWPAASAFKSFGSTSFGYGEVLDLPVAVTPRDSSQPVRLRLALSYAVCAEVCVPEQARLETKLPLRAGGSSSPAARLDEKIGGLGRPRTAASAGLALSCRVRGDAFEFNVRPAGRIRRPAVAIEILDPVGAREAGHGAIGWRRDGETATLVTELRDAPSAPVQAHLFAADADGRALHFAPIACAVDVDQTARE